MGFREIGVAHRQPAKLVEFEPHGLLEGSQHTWLDVQ